MSGGLTAGLVVGGSTLAAVAVLIAVRRRDPALLDGADNDVAGFVYALVGVIYGIVLAFVIFAVWERFSTAGQAATTEAAAVVAIYRDTQTFPPHLRARARQSLRDYIDGVTDAEWTVHVGGGAHSGPDRLNAVWDVWRRARPPDPDRRASYDAALERLHALEQQRHLRHLAVESTLPGIFWPVLIIGALITIAFSYLFRMQRFLTQALITGTVTTLVAGALFLIVSLNQPFTGIEIVSQEPFDHARQQFHAIDLRGTD